MIRNFYTICVKKMNAQTFAYISVFLVNKLIIKTCKNVLQY